MCRQFLSKCDNLEALCLWRSSEPLWLKVTSLNLNQFDYTGRIHYEDSKYIWQYGTVLLMSENLPMANKINELSLHLVFIYSFIIISLLIYTINNKPHHTTLYKYKCQNIHDIALSCDQNIHAIVVLISCLVKYPFIHAQLYARYVMLVFVLSRRTPGHITYDGLLFFLPNVSNQYLLNKVYNHKTGMGKIRTTCKYMYTRILFSMHSIRL